VLLSAVKKRQQGLCLVAKSKRLTACMLQLGQTSSGVQWWLQIDKPM
jgi:hypothetical protein